MNNKFKFIHTADIHLGRKVSYNGNPDHDLSAVFNNAEKKALKRLVDLALKKEVDFIIIAGDLYDQEARSVKSSRFFLEQCQKLNDNNIKIYIISGNHDPAGKSREVFELPENVEIFSSEEVESKEFYKNKRLTARILGQSYRKKFESRSMYNYYNAEDDSVFNLGILHTELDSSNRRYVPVNKSELLSKDNIHYWALGHIHQHLKINKKPAVYYPGTIQGRDINEAGDKGAILVEVDQNLAVNSSFYPLSPVNFKKITIDLEMKKDLKNISDLDRILNEEIESLSKKIEIKNKTREYELEGCIVRFVIKGRTKLQKYISQNRFEMEENLLEELKKNYSSQKEFIWPNSISLRTSKALPNLEDIKDKNPIFKEVDRIINDILEDQELNEELRAEWGKIWQGTEDSEERENDRFYADQNFLAEILEEAEKTIISELIEDGD